MKRLLIALVCFFAANTLLAQNCVFYYPSSETARWQYDLYNNKDNKCGSVTGKLLSKIVKGDTTILTIENTSYNLDNSPKGKFNYKYICKNNLFYLDVKSLIDPQTFEDYKDFDLNITGDSVSLPPNMAAGQNLDNFTIKVSFTNRGTNVFNCTLKSINRKVAAVESVTTPAGTYECAKITYTLETNTYTRAQTAVTEWYAKEIGLVKSTVFDTKKKQVQISRTELKKFKK